MLTGVDVGSVFLNLRLKATLGKVWNVTRTTGFDGIVIDNVSVVACDTVGTINAMLAANIENLIVLSATTDGLSFTGTFQTITIDDYEVLSTSASFTAVDLGTCVADAISISHITYNGVAGGVGHRCTSADEA